jgi:hypothetical protein
LPPISQAWFAPPGKKFEEFLKILCTSSFWDVNFLLNQRNLWGYRVFGPAGDL